MLLEDFALDADHAEARAIWFGLLSAAAHEAALAKELVRFDSEVRVVLGEILTEMGARGEAPFHLDPEAEARAILAFNLGLNLNVRMQPRSNTNEVVRAEVEAYLARLTAGVR